MKKQGEKLVERMEKNETAQREQFNQLKEFGLQETFQGKAEEKPIPNKYILADSKLFRFNPKLISGKCITSLHIRNKFTPVNTSLPEGWKFKVHTKPDGNMDKDYLAPDGKAIKSKNSVLEYLAKIKYKKLREMLLHFSYSILPN